MGKVFVACSLLLAGTGLARAAPAESVGQGSGWTGNSNPRDVIRARQELMEHMEILMEPIDTITVKPVGDVARLHGNAESISAMLLAVPHLFPPTTNRYDPQAPFPETLALAPIWQDWNTFYRLAGNAAKAAGAMANAAGAAPLRRASLALRASCDACHVLFLRKYAPPRVLESDYNFDFNRALQKR